MRPQDPEPLAVGAGRAYGIGARAIGVVLGGSGRGTDAAQSRFDLGVSDPCQALSG